MKILIAEDERVTRRNLQRYLESWGHEVITAENGAIAWDILQQQDIPVVITDWEMPEMDGLELLCHIRQRADVGYVYVILLTTKSEKTEIVEGMDAGADDFLSKPFDRNELRVRIRAGIRIIELEQDLEQRNKDVTLANKRMKNDLDAAASLQRSFLPVSLPEIPGLEFSWAYQPCDELAGDILNVICIDENHIGIYVADVSGHGVPAALLSVTISRVLNVDQEHLSSDLIISPADVVCKLNHQFQMEKLNQRYFTLVYGILNITTLEFKYVSAGHPPILRVSGCGESHLLPNRNFAVGWFPDATFEEHVIQLQPEDRIYLYSDGILEAMNSDSEQFGTDRLVDFLSQKPKLSLENSVTKLSDTIMEWSASGKPRDDISILALEINQN